MRAGAGAHRSLTQILTVHDVDGARVWLRVERASACASCAMRRGCGAGALAETRSRTPELLVLPYQSGLAPGDRVEISMRSSAFLGAAALAFLIPVLTLVAGVALASALGASDVETGLACVPLLALSLWPLRSAESRTGTSALRIERVLPPGTS